MNNTRILRYGDMRLLKPAQPLVDWNRDAHRVSQAMSEILYKDKLALAVAANQVGSSHRFFMYKDAYGKRRIVINPVVKEQTNPQLTVEGCLSFPDTTVVIPRPLQILVNYISFPELVEVQEVWEGLLAQVFCHETDHLDGILMIDHLSKEDRDVFGKRYQQALRNYRTRENSTRRYRS